MNLEEKRKFITNFAYFVVLAFIIYFSFWFATVYLLPFILGVILAFFVQKPATALAKKIKIKKEICAAVLSVSFYIIVVTFLALLFWVIYTQSIKMLNNLAENTSLPSKIENLFFYCLQSIKNSKKIVGEKLYEFVSEATNNFIFKFSNWLSGVISSFIKRIPLLVINVAITVVASCYIAKDFDKLKKFVLGFVDKKIINKIADVKVIFVECFFKFTVGYFLLYLLTFFELLVGLLMLRVKNFILLSLVIALVDVLPILGTGTVLLPWSIIEFVQENYSMGLGLVILYVLIAAIRNFFEPKIIGQQIGINPLFTLLFIFIGLRIGGIGGMIIVPMVLSVVFTYYRKQINTENS